MRVGSRGNFLDDNKIDRRFANKYSNCLFGFDRPLLTGSSVFSWLCNSRLQKLTFLHNIYSGKSGYGSLAKR